MRHYRWLLIWIIGGITGAVIFLSVAMLFLFPLYAGEASVTILPTEAELAYTKGWLTGSQFNPSETMVATHIEYLESRPVAERTLAKLQAALPPGVPPTGWKADLNRKFKEFMAEVWRIYNTLNSGKFVEPTEYESALNRLMKGIDLEAVENSFILKIEVTMARNPEAAAIAANALAEAYVERVAEQAKEIADALDAFFQQEVETREVALDGLEQREYELRKQHGLLAVDEERQALIAARDAESERIIQTEIARQELEARLTAFAGKQSELQRRGVLQKVEEEIALSEAQFRALERRQAIRRQSIASISAKLAALAEKEQPLIGLEREKDRLEQDIADLRGRMILINLSRTSDLSQVRIVNPATVPDYPAFPEVVLNTFIGLFGSIMIAFFVLIVIDTVSDTVKTEVDLRRLAGDRALGRLRRRLVKRLAKPTKRLGRRHRKQLEAMGATLEPRLAALGDLEKPAIQVTGFGPPGMIVGAARSIAGALAIRDNRVSCSMSESLDQIPPPAMDGGRALQLLEENPDPQADGLIRIECVGPLAAGFKWEQVAQRSPALICAFEAGALQEDTIRQFQNDASSNGVSALSFVMIER